MLDAFLGLFSRDIGIDLGTANTLVHVRDRGIVISEPSVVAIEAKSKKVLAIGAEAKRMVGRTPASIIAVRPLRDGVISDFDVTEQMIKYFVQRVHDDLGKRQVIATKAAVQIATHLGKLPAFLLLGFDYGAHTTTLVPLLAAAVAGTLFGKRFLSGISTSVFRRLFAGVLALIAFYLIATPLLG